jgi:hypothetical protein
VRLVGSNLAGQEQEIRTQGSDEVTSKKKEARSERRRPDRCGQVTSEERFIAAPACAGRLGMTAVGRWVVEYSAGRGIGNCSEDGGFFCAGG